MAEDCRLTGGEWPATIENELAVLERGLRALQVEYERFFRGPETPPNGHPPSDGRPPQRLAGVNVEKAAERFRLQNIQSRFHSLTELWEKRLVARAEGKPVGDVRRARERGRRSRERSRRGRVDVRKKEGTVRPDAALPALLRTRAAPWARTSPASATSGSRN